MNAQVVLENAVEFLGYHSDVVISQIEDTHIEIQLVATSQPVEQSGDVYPGEPIAKLTVRVPGVEMPSMAVAIKGYSENTGVVDALVSAGVIEPPAAHLDIFGGAPTRVQSAEDANAYVAVAMLSEDVRAALCLQGLTPGV